LSLANRLCRGFMLPMSGLPEVRSGLGPESRAEFPQYKQIYGLAKWHLSFPFVFVYIWR
jgi:hypothetical protein